jgi:MFS family permease
MTTQTTQKILTHDFVLAFVAQIALACVFFILIPTLPIYLSRLKAIETEIGVLIGVFSFSSLVARPFIGRALVKIPEKTIMIVGALLYALTSFAYLVTVSFWPFLIVRIFQGMGYALFQTASITLIANTSSETHRGQSLSSFILAFNVGGALAPPLGIFLMDRFGFNILFLTCTGLSLGAVFLTTKLGSRPTAPLQDSSTGEGFFLSRKAIPPSIIGFFPLFILGTLHAFFPLYATNHGMTNPGLFFTTTAILLVLGRSFAGKLLDLYSRERIILPCLIAYFVSMALLAFSKNLPMFILVAVIWGAGHAFSIPALVLYALDRAGSAGPAMATFHAITDLGMSLGPMAMGVVLRLTGYPIMFLCLALISVVDLSYFYFFMRKRKD